MAKVGSTKAVCVWVESEARRGLLGAAWSLRNLRGRWNLPLTTEAP